MTDQQVDFVKELNSLDGRWITLLWVSLLAVGSGTLRLVLEEPRESVHILVRTYDMDWITVGAAVIIAIGIGGTALIVAFRSMKS